MVILQLTRNKSSILPSFFSRSEFLLVSSARSLSIVKSLCVHRDMGRTINIGMSITATSSSLL